MDFPKEAPPKGPLRITALPLEVQQMIFEYIFESRATIHRLPGKPPGRKRVRRGNLSSLAVISNVWRALIEEELYRHIRVEGTVMELDACKQWFTYHPDLKKLVKHIEIWIPSRDERVNNIPRSGSHSHPQSDLERFQIGGPMPGWSLVCGVDRYCPVQRTASLNAVFDVVNECFTSATTFTVEGSSNHHSEPVVWEEEKKNGRSVTRHLAKLDNINVFAMRGAFTVFRNWEEWHIIRMAIPNMKEWHCSYLRAQGDNYYMMNSIFGSGKLNIRHLNLCLEGISSGCNDHRPDNGDWGRVPTICNRLGPVAFALETLTFTGLVSHDFFRVMRETALNSAPEISRLRSVDITAAGCCRHYNMHPGNLPPRIEGIKLWGIKNRVFNEAFHEMVLEAVKALAYYPNVTSLRIRFVDLHGALHLFNPYFEMEDDRCTGLWSDEILEQLRLSRPSARFVELSNGIEPVVHGGRLIGVRTVTTRPLSILARQYLIISNRQIPP